MTKSSLLQVLQKCKWIYYQVKRPKRSLLCFAKQSQSSVEIRKFIFTSGDVNNLELVAESGAVGSHFRKDTAREKRNFGRKLCNVDRTWVSATKSHWHLPVCKYDELNILTNRLHIRRWACALMSALVTSRASRFPRADERTPPSAVCRVLASAMHCLQQYSTWLYSFNVMWV